MISTLLSIKADQRHVGSDTKTYDNHLIEIAQFNTVPVSIPRKELMEQFWRIMNNLPMDIPNRDSLHMFKRGIKPRWEDPRNKDGGSSHTSFWRQPVQYTKTGLTVGAWTFRVPQDESKEVFQYILLLSIADQLNPHMEERIPSFRHAELDDDICGISVSTRAFSNLISVWNRFAPRAMPSGESSQTDVNATRHRRVEDMEKGVDRMKEVILSGLRKDLRPQTMYYRVQLTSNFLTSGS